MTKNRKRVLNLESLETKRVFSANGLASPVAVESDVVSNGVSEFPDSPLTNDDIRALHSGKPFHLEINKGKLTIRALIGEHHITVSKLRGRRLQITATNMSDPRRAYSEVVSSRGIKDILYFGTYKADSFQNDTNIRSTARGGSGNDTLRGGSASDLLIGGKGDDRLYGNKGKDDLRGMDGRDIIYGGQGHDVLDGGNSDDQLFGDAGNDKLLGGAGNDYLSGGKGRDKLFGERGADRLHGGAGSDDFYFEKGVDALLDATRKDRLHPV